MLIQTTLVATNDTHSEAVSFDIPDQDWSLLAVFVKRCEVLRSTRFVQEERGGSITFNWKAGGPVRMGSERLEEEPIWAMLLKIRPFVLQNERCYLPSILKMLKRHLSHPATHRHVDQLRDAFMLKSMNQRIQMSGPGRPPLSQAVVIDWLNSYHYHNDEEKAESVVRDLGPFAKHQDGLGVATFALVDMVQAVLATGDLIETLQLCHEGSMPEIRCPADYFDQP